MGTRRPADDLSSDLVDGLSPCGHLCREILVGTKPGNLPIEQASKLTFVINLKTAKALGITVPPGIAFARRKGDR